MQYPRADALRPVRHLFQRIVLFFFRRLTVTMNKDAPGCQYFSRGQYHESPLGGEGGLVWAGGARFSR